MSDAILNKFVGTGTDAERLALVLDPPDPPAGPNHLYVWYSHDTDELWAYVTALSPAVWILIATAVGTRTTTLGITIDGGGVAITTGIKGDLRVPFACTITKATVLADQSGSIVIDVWKDTYANFPPTDADSITASAPPTLSGAAKSEDSTLTGWTTSLAAGDILRFNVDSAATVQRVVLHLDVTY